MIFFDVFTYRYDTIDSHNHDSFALLECHTVCVAVQSERDFLDIKSWTSSGEGKAVKNMAKDESKRLSLIPKAVHR